MSSKTKKAKPKAAKTRKTKAKPKKTVKRPVAKAEPEKEVVRKAKKPAERKEAERPSVAQAKRTVVEAPQKLGPPPAPVVSSRHMDSMHERAGRGFSFAELDSAGVPESRAKREGVSVDVRRRSVLEDNVEALKAWYRTPAGGESPKEES